MTQDKVIQKRKKNEGQLTKKIHSEGEGGEIGKKKGRKEKLPTLGQKRNTEVEKGKEVGKDGVFANQSDKRWVKEEMPETVEGHGNGREVMGFKALVMGGGRGI